MGLVRHWWFLWRYRIGLLRGFRPVEWGRVRRLVFVCRGNICRSPYAEAAAGAAGLRAASFGLEIGEPAPANEAVARIASAKGIDLGGHRSRRPSDVALTRHDLLLGMEPWHGRALARSAAGTDAQISLLGLWACPPRPHIEDPYGLSSDYFLTCTGVIDDAVARIAGILAATARPPGGS